MISDAKLRDMRFVMNFPDDPEFIQAFIRWLNGMGILESFLEGCTATRRELEEKQRQYLENEH